LLLVLNCHAIAWMGEAAVTHLGYVRRYVFTKAGIESALHNTRFGLYAIPECILLRVDRETALNTVTLRIYLAGLYMYPSLYRKLSVVEMIYLRDCSTVYYFDPTDS
jgi:hypothetical protein